MSVSNELSMICSHQLTFITVCYMFEQFVEKYKSKWNTCNNNLWPSSRLRHSSLGRSSLRRSGLSLLGVPAWYALSYIVNRVIKNYFTEAILFRQVGNDKLTIHHIGGRT